MEKRFTEWIDLKARLHLENAHVPHVNEGDIWWASLGENIGFEINGKSRLFSRPVIILKKMMYGFYFVIPTTTQIKDRPWLVPFRHNFVGMEACIHQARPIDYRRLSSRIGQIDESDFFKIRERFKKFFS